MLELQAEEADSDRGRLCCAAVVSIAELSGGGGPSAMVLGQADRLRQRTRSQPSPNVALSAYAELGLFV